MDVRKNKIKNKHWKKIESKLIQYYTKYYRDSLGIPNYHRFVEERLMEDQNFIHTFRKVKALIPFFYLPSKNQKVLVIGAGTGAELVNFIKMGYNAYGVEPNSEAFKIVQLKFDYYRINKNKIKKSVAEKLPFPDSSFKMVWAWTVLEHVEDVDKTLKEIYRVLKPGGWAFLTMPDTRQFWEGHYKIYLPLFLPRLINKIILKIKKRPTCFFDKSINRISVKKVRNVVQHLNFRSMLIYHPWDVDWKEKRNRGMNLVYWTTVTCGIPRDQWWLLYKIS